jgi:tetratricopeptide (TPR) repeat protein
MADGLLGTIVGDEDEKPEVETVGTLPSADAFAAAVAAKLAGNDTEVARDTSAFLKKHADVLQIQAEHLKAEHTARLHFLQGQAREVDLRRVGLRLRIGFQVFVALAATVIGVGFAILIRDAFTSRRVVIEPFHTPAALTASGVDGVVVAGGLLDDLNRLQAATQSSTQKATLTNAWERGISIAVPEAGLSIGELSQALRERFGNDVHIGGDLLQTPAGGLALTVRGLGMAPRTFAGGIGDLGRLTHEAAEYVYGQSRPALWSAYLTGTGRYAEAIAYSRSALRRTGPVERARILDMWSNAEALRGGSIEEALVLARAAVDTNPDDWGAAADIAGWLACLGDEEGAWHAGEEMRRRAGGRPGRASEVLYNVWDGLTWNLPALAAEISGDLDVTAGAGTNFGPQWAFVPVVMTQMHDPEAAELALNAAAYDATDGANETARHWANAMIAGERARDAAAVQEWSAAMSGYSNAVVFVNVPNLPCYAAPIYERAGLHIEADHALAAVGNLKFVDCYRFHGDILDGRGDWAGAQKAYAAAVALAPDLPAAYYSWGTALARHGDFAGAEAKLRDANQRGPHWADPLKAWGDVLVKHGKPKDALAKYDEALRYASKWQQLKDARELATKQRT